MKKTNKGLQKFTDSDNLKTVEDFKKLKENNPDEFENAISSLYPNLNKALNEKKDIEEQFDRLENALSLIGEEKTTSIKRERWRINEAFIKQAIHNKVMKSGHVPSVTEISEETGLSRVTISKHLTETNLSQFKNEQQETFKILNTNVLQKIYRIGMQTNDLKALKLFFQLTGGNIQPETVVNNNYIQVNNTKINNAIINQLPMESLEAIEKIIIENKTVEK